MSVIGSALIATPPAGWADGPSSTPSGRLSVPGPAHMPNLAVLSIEGEINAVTTRSFVSRLDKAIDQGADGIVVDLDTPGGEVGAVLEICTAIKQSPLYTIAWINPTAYSGGAIIALACDEIVLASGATMGDAAPVAGDPIRFAQGIPQTEREKILAPLIAEIVDSAARGGYDEVLVIALVQLGVETWMVERDSDGAVFFLSEREYIDLFGEQPERGRLLVPSGRSVVSSQSEAGSESDPDAQPTVIDAREYDDDIGWDRATGGILSEGTRRALDDTQFSVASARPEFRGERAADYTLIGYATDGKTLLTLKESQLQSFGFSAYDQTIDDDEDLKAYVGATNIARLDQTWSESLVAFMTQGASGYVVRGLLIVVFLLAMFIEMTMPGVGLPGTIAIVALAGLIVPPMMIGASTWWALASIIAGVGLIMLEILVFPGFGLPGIGGLVLMMVGLVGTFAQTGEMFPGAGNTGQSQLVWAVSTVLLAIFGAGVGMFFFTKYTRSVPIASKLVLFERQEAHTHDGLIGAMADPSAPASLNGLTVGDEGVAATPLHPSGTAEIGDQLVDVVSEQGYVEAGERIRVVNLTEYRVGVEPIKAGGPSSRPAGDSEDLA